MPVFNEGRWGHCPRCETAFHTRPECPSCGWRPAELLNERLEEVRRLRRDGLPGVPDKGRLAADLAEQGIGATGVLIQLGAIANSDWVPWIKRFLDAAEIESRPWASGVWFSLGAEGGPHDGKPDDHDPKDES